MEQPPDMKDLKIRPTRHMTAQFEVKCICKECEDEIIDEIITFPVVVVYNVPNEVIFNQVSENGEIYGITIDLDSVEVMPCSICNKNKCKPEIIEASGFSATSKEVGVSLDFGSSESDSEDGDKTFSDIKAIFENVSVLVARY